MDQPDYCDSSFQVYPINHFEHFRLIDNPIRNSEMWFIANQTPYYAVHYSTPTELHSTPPYCAAVLYSALQDDTVLYCTQYTEARSNCLQTPILTLLDMTCQVMTNYYRMNLTRNALYHPNSVLLHVKINGCRICLQKIIVSLSKELNVTHLMSFKI